MSPVCNLKSEPPERTESSLPVISSSTNSPPKFRTICANRWAGTTKFCGFCTSAGTKHDRSISRLVPLRVSPASEASTFRDVSSGLLLRLGITRSRRLRPSFKVFLVTFAFM